MQLPYSEELNIEHLGSVLNKKSECYKLFWLKAIVSKVAEGKCELTYEELVDKMIADAWYMVTEYHLNLGPNDTLEKLVLLIKSKYPEFKSNEKESVILSFLKNTDDREIIERKRILTKNVPYHLQEPFFTEVKGNAWKVGENELIRRINQEKRLLYYFSALNGLSTKIILQDDWFRYIEKNKAIIDGWIEYNMIIYLQRRNPSVPGIADKLRAPQSRDIDRVRKYWKLIIDLRPDIREIYGNKDMAGESISVDHFVPWQYVAHDELWNLHPTTKSINSSKSNGLPEWDLYFEPLYRLEYLSYTLSKENEKIAEAFNKVSKYHLNNEEIARTLYCTGLTEGDFGERLSNVIRPIYNAAKNSGFKEWRYEEAACQ